MNIKHIIKGWAKSAGITSTSDQEQAMSLERLQICGDCPEAEESQVLKFINGSAEYYPTLKCTRCGCPCVQKTLVATEHCPLGKW